ncbi:MAG TPA: cytidylate kinase-like family protein [Candidatus Baltobacteraceae bacterium]|nr:cytidylate kinase-like family protein [Candidatus Baltobacteraceae bacterium]
MIVTISNEYGCGALAVAHLVAGQLQYEYVDEQLPVVVAKRLQTSPQAVEAAEQGGESVGDRMLRALESGTPEIASGPPPGPTFDEECLREVQETVREFAAHGNVVLVGRGGGAILGRRPDVLRVFLFAPRDWRIGHIAEAFDVDDKTAAAEIDRIDRARAKYIETYYSMKWADARNYDLALDVASFGTEGAAAAIVGAVRAR